MQRNFKFAVCLLSFILSIGGSRAESLFESLKNKYQEENSQKILEQAQQQEPAK